MFTWQNHVHNEYIQRAGSGGRMFASSATEVWEFHTVGQIICGLVVWSNLKPRSSNLCMIVLLYNKLPETNCVTEFFFSLAVVCNDHEQYISSPILKTKIVGPSKILSH